MGDAATLVRAIAGLIETKSLAEELKMNTDAVGGHFVWQRRVLEVKRALRVVPISEPPDPKYEYLIHWWTERKGQNAVEGKWVGSLALTLEAFERFLIQGQDLNELKDLFERFNEFLT